MAINTIDTAPLAIGRGSGLAGHSGYSDAACRIRVFVMDLLSIVPYYTGYLCASLEQGGRINVTLGSITYHHDRGFFERKGLRNIPGLLDVVSRLRIAPAARRALKLFESLI